MRTEKSQLLKQVRASIRRAQAKARKARKAADAFSAAANGAAQLGSHSKSKPAIAPTIGEQE